MTQRSDILLNVFLAIAVDNLADAESLNKDEDKKGWRLLCLKLELHMLRFLPKHCRLLIFVYHRDKKEDDKDDKVSPVTMEQLRQHRWVGFIALHSSDSLCLTSGGRRGQWWHRGGGGGSRGSVGASACHLRSGEEGKDHPHSGGKRVLYLQQHQPVRSAHAFQPVILTRVRPLYRMSSASQGSRLLPQTHQSSHIHQPHPGLHHAQLRLPRCRGPHQELFSPQHCKSTNVE